MNTFGVVDILVFSSVFLLSVGIGLYYKNKQKSAVDYILSNQNAGVLPVSFSLMASFMSAVTLLGVSKENYVYGTQFLLINVAYGLGTPIVAYIYLPVFFRQRSLSSESVYGYLESRFGKITRTIASLCFSLQIILYMSVVLYAPSLTLSALTGIDLQWNILLMGVSCTFYSVLGGFSAILMTDVLQSLLMITAMLSIVISGIGSLGWNVITDRSSDRLQFFDLNFDPRVRHTFWSQMIGGFFTYCSIYAVNQTQVQRLLSLKDLKNSQISLWLQYPILLLLSSLTAFSGLIMYAYYKGCDPLLQGRIQNSDSLLPLFVIDTMQHLPGITGLFVAGIFSGSLSTISSAINSLASVTLQDYIQPLRKIHESKELIILKALVLLYGVLCVILAFTVNIIGSSLLTISLTIFGIVGGPIFGLFTLGMFWEFPNQKGALPAFLISLSLLCWMGFGQPKPIPPTLELSTSNCTYTLVSKSSSNSTSDTQYFLLYTISYAWYSLIGFFVTVFLGGIFSWLFKSSSVKNPDLYVFWTRNNMIKRLASKTESTKSI